jgi:methylenetetrahydrofolate dehydrogenase (NADP+)/methenyltetrahydrofolate cyclohydrolase
MIIIEGQKIAKEIIEKLKKLPKPEKFLGVFVVGSDKITENFVNKKKTIAEELKIDFRVYHLPETIKNDDLRKEILKTSKHKTCGGVIVQLPLPNHINKNYVLNVIPREKDIDVLGERALGAFYNNRNPITPPAVGVVEEIIKNLKLDTRNLKIAVIGRGSLVGRPIALWLMDKVTELSVFNKQTKNLKEKLKNFDIVISGVGQANLFGPDDLKENAGVIDFGYSLDENGKLKGDFNSQLPAINYQSLAFYTKTPGGTGPILIAKLFENFYKLLNQ